MLLDKETITGMEFMAILSPHQLPPAGTSEGNPETDSDGSSHTAAEEDGSAVGSGEAGGETNSRTEDAGGETGGFEVR